MKEKKSPPPIQPFIGLMIGLIMGFILWRREHHILASCVWGISGAITLSAVILPSLYAQIQHGLHHFSRFIGTLLNFLLLAPLYLLFFPPLRLLRKLRKIDKLQRKVTPSSTSYWQTPSQKSKNYTRQY